jgi:hypothetical protein
MRPEPTINLDALPATHRPQRSRNGHVQEDVRAAPSDHLVIKIAAGIVLGWVAVTLIKLAIASLAIGTAIAAFN